MTRHDYVSDKEIEKCMIMAAELVDRYGDEMIPLLHRLEGEYALRKQKRDAPKQADRIKAMLAADRTPPA